MKIKNWIACVQDRGKWKEVVEKAKTFNQEVQRLEEEEGADSGQGLEAGTCEWGNQIWVP